MPTSTLLHDLNALPADLHGLVAQYIEQTTSGQRQREHDLKLRFDSDSEFRDLALRCANEAIVVSTLAAVMKTDEDFSGVLATLMPADETFISQMRKDLFVDSFEIALESIVTSEDDRQVACRRGAAVFNILEKIN